VSSEERRARRRDQLLAAGLELFGTRGYRASSVREICLAASLNRRYFYESFRAREDLLRAIYDELVLELAQHVLAATDAEAHIEAKIRSGLTAFWDWVTADHRRAQILTVEIIGVSPDLEARRREARHGFAEFIAAQAIEAAGDRPLDVDVTIVSRALVASTIDLVIDWMRDDIEMSVPQVIDESIRFYSLASRTALGGA
jgi:AcrR family transcriptional regulator